MFSGFASLIPWPGAKRPTTSSVDPDLERGDENVPRTDDDRFSSIGSFRVVDSSASSATGENLERDLPNLPQDDLDDDLSTPEGGVGPSSEESTTAAVPGFLAMIAGSAPTPPEISRINPPPDSILQQLQDQYHLCAATSSPSSASSNHTYTRFFHRTRTPKRTRSTRSLEPGGLHRSSGALSPIYEPSSPDLRDLAVAQKKVEAVEPRTFPKKTPAPSIHSTASTIQERIMSLQATHPAFLKRSLKRSLSQTSSGSLHSEASGAPQLPPLHFRPAFTGITVGILSSPSTPSPGPPSATCSTTQLMRVVVPTRPPLSVANSPQRSRLPHSQPNTPQSLITPRSHRFGFLDHSQKCSAIYEDSVSEKSFVTATSGETGPGPGAITKHDIPSTAQLVIYPEDQEQARNRSEHVGERQRTFQEQPSNSTVVIPTPERPRIERETAQHRGRTFCESETTFNATSDSQHNPDPVAAQKQNRTGAASVMSIASTTVRNESVMVDDRLVEETATVVEDEGFITERWMKTLFYSVSVDKELFSTAKGGDGKQHPVSSTCVLFWVGFIAPWCWLVGGWMPPRNAPVLKNGVKHDKLKEKISMDVDRETVSRGEDGSGLGKWILPDPSSSFKATTWAPSISSTTSLHPGDIGEARLATADPWVRRCRIASVVGGVILGLGLITMVIVLGVAMH